MDNMDYKIKAITDAIRRLAETNEDEVLRSAI